jgi:succinate dehydrogenase / fumarate reductase cytochrome b subunit
MPTTATSKRHIRTNSVPSRQGFAGWISPFLRSSIGGKYIVAFTGLILTGFVVVHMLGNLNVFAGQTSLNAYADSMKQNPGLLWTARCILLGAFCLHIGMALWLNWKAWRARPTRYAYNRTVQASLASRHMVLTGLLILAFTLYHIAHYTLGVAGGVSNAAGKEISYLDLHDAKDRPDVYSMVIFGFSNPIIAGLYILAQVCLFLHLTHGVASMFQTVGLNTPRAQQLIRRIAWVVALVVCLGNIGIVAGVYAGAWMGMMVATPPPADSRQLPPVPPAIPPPPVPGK